MTGFSTKAVHGPGENRDPHGALRPPVYDSVAFEFASSRDLELAFAGRKPAHTYSRITNPTVDELEKRVRHLTGSLGVVAVSSGMAAITNVVLSLARSGSNIVTSRHLFGHSLSLFTRTLGEWGLETRFADMTEPDSVEELIDSSTALVFLEVISNPQLEVADIKTLCEKAAKKGVPVVLDGTLTSSYLFNSKEAGVAVEVISSTKFISGGATSLGGLIIDNGTFDWKGSVSLGGMSKQYGPGAFLMRLRKEVNRNIGGCLSAHNAWLQILGLETLPLRAEACSRNALAIAGFLGEQQRVVSVNYPGLEHSRWHATAASQFKRGFGGLVTFKLSDKEQSFVFMDSLKLIRKATNLNDNKTLIIHPASTIFADYSAQECEQMGISEGLIRLSVGIEDTDDLIDDLKQGLETV